jgi:hypothetical protein
LHYRNPLLYRAPEALPSVFFGRREPNKKHSAKPLHLAKKFLCRVQKKTLGKDFFAECQSKTLGKLIFQTTFWCPKQIQIKKFSTTKFHNFS